jgi:hypothetical protein
MRKRRKVVVVMLALALAGLLATWALLPPRAPFEFLENGQVVGVDINAPRPPRPGAPVGTKTFRTSFTYRVPGSQQVVTAQAKHELPLGDGWVWLVSASKRQVAMNSRTGESVMISSKDEVVDGTRSTRVLYTRKTRLHDRIVEWVSVEELNP